MKNNLFVLLATIVSLALISSVNAQSAFEFNRMAVECDTAPTHVYPADFNPHHVVMVVQSNEGDATTLKAFQVGDSTELHVYLLDECTQIVFDSNSPWHEFLFSLNDGVWEITEFWNGAKEYEFSNNRIYLNWAFMRKGGITHKVLLGVTAETTSLITGIRTIRSWYYE